MVAKESMVLSATQTRGQPAPRSLPHCPGCPASHPSYPTRHTGPHLCDHLLEPSCSGTKCSSGQTLPLLPSLLFKTPTQRPKAERSFPLLLFVCAFSVLFNGDFSTRAEATASPESIEEKKGRKKPGALKTHFLLCPNKTFQTKTRHLKVHLSLDGSKL